jgi:glycosyltransferase involved in cell wall biosynthesis
MIVAGLRSTTFIGGPERQMLGLAGSFSAPDQFVFMIFSERGRGLPALEGIRGEGFTAIELTANLPDLRAMSKEVARQLRSVSADLLCCYGYKADMVGLIAARHVGIPVVAVSQGWTAATARVRVYERVDRYVLRWMDRVVCVSEGQAAKVRQAGVRPDRIVVIHDAVRSERFEHPDRADRERLARMFACVPDMIVGAAGRLSPEKGFEVLVEAAAIAARSMPGIGFIHFGDGPLRDRLSLRIQELGLNGRFVLAGFRTDLDRFLPHCDITVLPSFTEGLPNVVLESLAAGVPVVATAVGGTPEALADGIDGFLVPPGNPAALAGRINDLLAMGEARKRMGQRGQERVRSCFSFDSQAKRYREVFEELVDSRARQSQDRRPQPSLTP